MFTSKDYIPKVRNFKFIRKSGRLVRDVSGKEIDIRSSVKGDSLKKFSFPIGYHKWS